MPWYDLFAPVSASTHAWDYAEASALIVEQFGSYSPRMSDFAARAFRESWIDAEPRPGKQDPAAFQAGYDDLLASTGMADAATLAARM